jgi:hypothetical protein
MIRKVFYIPNNVDYIVVADMFAEDYNGGAELTLEAILDECPGKFFKLHAQMVSSSLIQANKNKHWIIGNFASLPKEFMIELALSRVNFSIIECDYKYCKYRSSHLHFLQEKQECNCDKNQSGIFIRSFFDRAQHVFFMSQKQKEVYEELFPAWLVIKNNFKVLSSIFSKKTLTTIKDLRENKKSNDKAIILSGGSWIKAQKETEEYCQQNNIKYELLGGLPPEDFIKKMAEYKSLIFHPAGFDTCPRLVIEAKLLRLELDLNDNVQHKDEEWFTGSIEDCERYLNGRAKFFWNTVQGTKQ